MSAVAETVLVRRRLALSLPLLAGLACFVLAMLAGTALLADPDVFWHVAAGRWIILHRAVPHADPFSGSMPGAPWVAHEWLAEVILAWLHDHLGWAGMVSAAAFAFAAAIAALTRSLLRFLIPLHTIAAVSGAALLCMPHLLVRPHVFGLALLVIWLGALVAARSRGRAPAPAVALVMLLWANLHGGYMIGLVLGALLGAEAVVTAPDLRAALRALRDWGGFGVLALAAACMTPNAIDGLLLPIHLMQMPYTLSILVEWASPNFQHFQPIEAWLLTGLLLALGYGVRLPWTRVAILLLLLQMAFAHQRNDEIFGLAAPLLLAPALGLEIARRRAVVPLSAFELKLAALARPAGAGGLAAMLAAMLGLSAAVVAHGLTRPADRVTPDAALAAVAAHHVEGQVLNDYSFGGYLIFAGIKPFVDGRADMYGDDFIKRYYRAVNLSSPDLPALLDEYRITWTLLERGSPGNVLLSYLPGWHRLFADETAIVYARETPLPP